MLIDGRDLAAGTRLEADVAIVGAGPVGIVLALDLADAGVEVALLESGARGRDRDVQRFTRGSSTGESYFPLHRTRVRGFAGTSLHWEDNGWFRARPLDPIDLGPRPEINRDGWPLDRADLDPWYERAHEVSRLGPFDYTPQRWATDERPLLPLDPSVVTTSIFQLTPFTVWRDRYEQVARHPGIQLVLHATVLELPTDLTADVVDPLPIRTPAGSLATVAAERYVLATGGLENARLLLLSDRRHQGGLGNGSGLVGRHFMEHLAVRAGRWRLDPDAIGLYLAHRPADPGLRIQGKLSLHPDVLADVGVLNGTFFLTPMTEHRAHPAVRSFVTLRRARTWRPLPGRLGAHLGQVLRHPAIIARTAIDEVLGRHRSSASLVQLMAMTEQAPHPECRVTLGRRKDAYGQRQLQLHWRLGELDRRSIRVAHEVIDEQLRVAGLGQLEDKLGDEGVTPQIQPQWHHLGTTRMDPDPRRGVVDTHGRVHGVRNLYVSGGSVFPTGGYANPTLTMVALALRLAGHLRDELAT